MAQMKKPLATASAGEKKAYEKYLKTRPSKEKLAEIKRPKVKPAPLGTAPKPPRRGTATPAPLRGPAAIAELQRQVSPSGVKKAESGVKKATDKKYPGLYKKSK
jgi:hypothetical protein